MLKAIVWPQIDLIVYTDNDLIDRIGINLLTRRNQIEPYEHIISPLGKYRDIGYLTDLVIYSEGKSRSDIVYTRYRVSTRECVYTRHRAFQYVYRALVSVITIACTDSLL